MENFKTRNLFKISRNFINEYKNKINNLTINWKSRRFERNRQFKIVELRIHLKTADLALARN